MTKSFDNLSGLFLWNEKLSFFVGLTQVVSSSRLISVISERLFNQIKVCYNYTMVMPKKTELNEENVALLKDEFVITDPQTGQKVPLKLALGRKQIKIENSLLYSILLFGTLSDEQLNEYVKFNSGKMSQNDKIAHHLYNEASKKDKDAINALIELNVAIAKRDKTTIINFGGEATQVQDRSDSILDRLENELAEITEAETVPHALPDAAGDNPTS